MTGKIEKDALKSAERVNLSIEEKLWIVKKVNTVKKILVLA